MRKNSILQKLATIAFFCFSLFACNEEEAEVEKFTLNPNEFYITINNICGWCAGGDSLLITKDYTYREHIKDCEGNKLTTLVETNQAIYSDLLSLLDTEAFEAININTCYVCADGCDMWITVNDGTSKHTIKFGYIDDAETIEPIKPFVDKLIEIRDSFFQD